MGDQRHVLAASVPAKGPGTQFMGGVGGPQVLSGQVRKIRPYWDSIPDRPGRSEPLYQLRYL